MCVCVTASRDWAGGWLAFLIVLCALSDEVSFSLSRTFLLHSQVLCTLLLIHDKVALLIIHKAMDISSVLVFRGKILNKPLKKSDCGN